MTGPEHYAAAERLVAVAREESTLLGQVYGKDQEYAELRLAEAQVHATLALIAATALDSDNRDWIEVAGGRFGGA